jgi:uncharacterized DUF497 family protein
MRISFDPVKRETTLFARGLDFARAGELFAGPTVTFDDERHNYGEPRLITAGYLDDRLVVVAWTPRDGTRRIISMRKANEREIAKFAGSLE